MSEDNKYIFYRRLFDADREVLEASAEFKNANLFELMKALQKVILRAEEKGIQHVVEMNNISVEDKSAEIIHKLRIKTQLSFFAYTRNQPIQQVILTFLAILDLLKAQVIHIFQDTQFDDIIITNKNLLN
jgi:segregation and condensation protein A